jgi:hypothetical protein
LLYGENIDGSTLALLVDGHKQASSTAIEQDPKPAHSSRLLPRHVRAFGGGKFTGKSGLNGEQKLLSFGPVCGLKGAISPGQSGTFGSFERAKAGKCACELTKMIQNDPHLKRFLL